jgi:hypothetical protein
MISGKEINRDRMEAVYKQPEWQVKQERKRLKAEKNKRHPRKREAQTWVVVDRSQTQREGDRSA